MSHAVQGHPRITGVVKCSDKTWSIAGGIDNPLKYSFLEKSMENMKRQKDITKQNKQKK